MTEARAEYSALTPAGREQFAEESEGWRLFSAAVGRILEATA